ncbi:MAG: TonB-dependent receptor plug domain-containing protein, partial [Pseudomonadota bacterium]
MTATRRAESANDVPFSLTAIGEAALKERNITEFDDVLRTLPNVNYIESDDGRQSIIVRGITAGPQGESSLV